MSCPPRQVQSDAARREFRCPYRSRGWPVLLGVIARLRQGFRLRPRASGDASEDIPRSPKGEAGWWSQTGSNRRPHACKARALPTELWPPWDARLDNETSLRPGFERCVVGPGRFELPTSRLSGVRSNQLSYGPTDTSGLADPDAACGARDRIAA